MGYLSVSLSHLQFPLYMFYSSQHISFSPPWPGLLPDILFYFLSYFKHFLKFSLSDILVKVKAAQSCLNLCNPMDYTVQGILQARILERVAVPFSSVSSQGRNPNGVFYISGGFFTNRAIREAQYFIVVQRNAKYFCILTFYNATLIIYQF